MQHSKATSMSQRFWFIMLCCVLTTNCKTIEKSHPQYSSLFWGDCNHSSQFYNNLMDDLLEISDMITAQIPVYQIDSASIFWYGKLAYDHNKLLALNIDFQNENRTRSITKQFQDTTFTKELKHKILQSCKIYNPSYLNLGVESNYYAIYSAEDYPYFIQFYNDTYSLLRKNGFKGHIGLSFQVDLLFGNHKGFNNDSIIAPLDAVAENLDFIGLSYYSHFSKLPIPISEYIEYLGQHYDNKFLGISEIGIEETSPIYDTNIHYLTHYNHNLKFITWGRFVDCPDDSRWYSQLGLLDKTGKEKYECTIYKTNEY